MLTAAGMMPPMTTPANAQAAVIRAASAGSIDSLQGRPSLRARLAAFDGLARGRRRGRGADGKKRLPSDDRIEG